MNKLFFITYVGLLLLTSCSHENLLIPKPNENIRPAADFIENNYDFRLFYAALEYTDLVGELNGPGPLTVLAPGDAAFNALGIRTPEDIAELDKDSLRRVLQYHVLKDRRLRLADIPTDAVDVRYETLSGDALFTSAGTRASQYYFDGAAVTHGDVALANGVLHVVNKLMKYHKGRTVQDYLAASPQYSLYVAGLKKFGLWDELAEAGPFTIFAPNNEAFAAHEITEEMINDFASAGYNGRRLFGAYILYGKHFFVSDKYVFSIISNEYAYSLPLKDDTWSLTFGFQSIYPEWYVYPELSLWGPPAPPYGIPPRIGQVNYNASESHIFNYDHRCENGIVHDLYELLILPEQAIHEE